MSEPTVAPFFSVVIATFNRKAMLRDAVDSVLSQSFNDLEVIVVDDGSTDGTSEWLTGMTDPRVRPITQANSKRGAARNRGISAATGRFVAFLDDDDAYDSNHLNRVADAARAGGSAFYSDVEWWDASTGKRRPFELDKSLARDPRIGCLWGAVFPLPGIVARRDVVLSCGAFPEEVELDGSEDFVFLARLASVTNIRRLSPASVCIREHPERGMLNVDYIVASRRAAMRVLLDEGRAGRPLDPEERKVLIAGTHRLTAALLYESGDATGARQELRSVRRTLGPLAGTRRTLRLWLLTWVGKTGRRLLQKTRNSIKR